MILIDDKTILKILNYIYDYSQENGYPPTQKEIGYQVGVIAPSSMHKILDYLIKNEYIQQSPSTMRTIEIKEKGYNLIGVKKKELDRKVGESLILYGSNEYYPLPPHIKYNYPLDSITLHKVEEKNLVHLGICFGDVLIISKSIRCKSGDMVIIKIEDKEYCRKVTNHRNYVSLEPSVEKDNYFNKKQIDIVGTVISLFRYY